MVGQSDCCNAKFLSAVSAFAVMLLKMLQLEAALFDWMRKSGLYSRIMIWTLGKWTTLVRVDKLTDLIFISLKLLNEQITFIHFR